MISKNNLIARKEGGIDDHEKWLMFFSNPHGYRLTDEELYESYGNCIFFDIFSFPIVVGKILISTGFTYNGFSNAPSVGIIFDCAN